MAVAGTVITLGGERMSAGTPKPPRPPLPRPAAEHDISRAQGKTTCRHKGRPRAGPGHSQGGGEAAPQGPGALMSHDLHKGILAKRTAAQAGRMNRKKAREALA